MGLTSLLVGLIPALVVVRSAGPADVGLAPVVWSGGSAGVGLTVVSLVVSKSVRSASVGLTFSMVG